MRFYNTTLNTHNMTPEDELDERWDGNLGYYPVLNPNEQQKELALESLFQQNCSINQTSSTAKEVCIHHITGHCRSYMANPL